MGVSSPINVPGARQSAGWIDTQNNFWIFGGNGYDSNGNENFLNDLWKFDGYNWTWISGSNQIDNLGYCVGLSSPLNSPGARSQHNVWIDRNNNFWLFGGQNAINGYAINDFWKLDLKCTPGYNGVTPCNPCQPGTYSNVTGSLCISCNAGTYSNITAATDSSVCMSCQLGTYSNIAGASNSSVCMACQPGTYSNIAGASVCMSCQPGTYSTITEASDSSVCIPCDSGTCSSLGANSCYPCNTSKHNSSTIVLTPSIQMVLLFLILNIIVINNQIFYK